MENEQPNPSGPERPWYYQNWFLIASFVLGWPLIFPLVLWPVWGILILRSPWHTHTLIKGLAWAMLIVGAVLVVKNFQGAQGTGFTVALIFPGVVVTIITQVMWTRFRIEHGLMVKRESPSIPTAATEYPPDRPRRRRRTVRRRSSKSDRTSNE